MGIALVLSFAWPGMPTPVPASAAATEFSAERAMAHLRVIAAKPHPTGTPAADEVRAYLLEQLRQLGFTVEVQDTTSLTDTYATRWGMPVVAAHVRNVIARRAGAAPGPALLLMAHYDSRELAPGASDDGYGVATLLETARALAASAPLKHALTLLFTEGEEQGLLGARAFFAESPAARDVGLVLNFEARGDRGPVFMFQTSEGAAALVDTMARVTPHVVASSLSQEVYRRMPNDTDLTVAIRAGVPSMNFANVDGFERYHQSTDTVDNASPATLQQHGSYALTLARAFGDAEPMVPPARGDEVYFDLGPVFVHYARGVATALAAIAVVLAAAAIGLARRGRRIRWGGVATAALLAVAVPIAAAIVAGAVGWLAMLAGARTGLAMQVARDGVKATYDGAMAMLGVAVAWGVLGAARARGLQAAEAGAGPLVVCTLLGAACAVLLPGGSFLFVWPAVTMALASLLTEKRAGMAALLARAVVAAITLTLIVPLARQLGVTFGPPIAPALAAIAALATTVVFPLLEAIAAPRGEIVSKPMISAPAALGAASFAAVVVALALPAFDAATPRPDSLVYVTETGRGAATWRSNDAAPDAWTSVVLQGALASPVSDVFPRSEARLLTAPAPKVEIAAPTATPTGDGSHLHIDVPPGTEVLSVAVPPDAHVSGASVEGRPFGAEPQDHWLDLAYFGPPARGIDLTLAGAPGAPLPVRLVAQLRGLPAQAAPPSPRPAGLMPAVGWTALRASDMTLVASTVRH